MSDDVMTPAHPRWQEFCDRLGVLLDAGVCPGSENPFILASAAMWTMGLGMEVIVGSFRYFKAHGGFCDCEILYNVEASAIDDALRGLSG